MRADRAGDGRPWGVHALAWGLSVAFFVTPTSGRGEDPIRIEAGIVGRPVLRGPGGRVHLEGGGGRGAAERRPVPGRRGRRRRDRRRFGRTVPVETAQATGARCPSIRVPDRPEAHRDARHPAGGRAAGDALGLEPAGPILGPTPAERGTAQGLPRRRRPVPGRGRGEPSSRPRRRRVRVPPAHHRARRARLQGRARPHALRSRAARPPDHPPPRSRSRPTPRRGSIATGSGRPGRARPSCRR